MHRTLLLLVCLAVATAVPVRGQDASFALGVGAGAGFPTGDLADDEANTGFGFDVHGLVQFSPMAGLYARYSRYSFGFDDASTGGVDVDIIDSGFGAGAHLSIPASGTSIQPWFQGGLVYDMVEIKGSEGGVSASIESDRKLGWEVGAGVDVGLGATGNVLLRPMIRYRTYPVEIEGEDGGDMNYVSLGVALLYRLGT